MAINIDRDVPPPSGATGSRDQGIAKAMRALQPGESIYLPDRTVTYASRIMHRVRKTRPYATFTSRTVAGGVRIWCLEDPLS